jgi:CBS domain-containing protein
MEHLDTFLARYRPFDALGRAVVADLARAAEEHCFESGEAVLVEDGVPAKGLFVVRTGSMAILHEGQEIDALEPGQCFGHPSLLSGMAPAFTVRARERSNCVFLPAPLALKALGTEAGAAYVASTMRTRLIKAGYTVQGLREVGTTPVSAIMRPPVFGEAELPVRSAAELLADTGVSALLVSLHGGGLGIVGDAEVRAAALASDGALEGPLRAIARAPAPTVPVGQLAIEATVDMLASGSEHVAVLDGEEVCGILSARDLLGLDANSPIALRHTILHAANEEVLVRAASHLTQLLLMLVRAGVPPRDLGRVLSLHQDALAARLIDFSISKHGSAPHAFAWLDMGSAARREFTLASDQDNALAYATPAADEAAHVDAYFERLASEVNDGLLRCGLSADNNGVLARNRLWRMPKSAWLRTFDDCLITPDESHLIRASVAFDFRAPYGTLSIAPELTERIRAAREHPQFMRLMARTAAGYPVALGFRSQIAIGKHGRERGRVDLKRGALVPLVNLVRFKALAHGVTISPTLDRIEAVASAGGLSTESADALREAFVVISRIRFEHHAEQIADGSDVDNLVDPAQLAPIARTELREAMRVVRSAQRQLGEWTPQP